MCRGAVTGRFAPSPSGRMHLGNLFAAAMSWLSARSRGGRWILRIEDLDRQRSKLSHALLIEDDLRWLGLDWDEGGVDSTGPCAPYCQSARGDLYARALARLHETGLTYACTCRRADLLAANAPHQSDGSVVYAGTCRPATLPAPYTPPPAGQRAAVRVAVDNTPIEFTDRHYGPQHFNLAEESGDFVVWRADATAAYQLAVTVDDAAMGVTEVVRGHDLLLSGARQIHLCRLLGLEPPVQAHIPLVVNPDGTRLSKRDGAVDAGSLRSRHSADEVRGAIAFMAGLQPDTRPLTTARLLELYRPPAFSAPTVTAPAL